MHIEFMSNLCLFLNEYVKSENKGMCFAILYIVLVKETCRKRYYKFALPFCSTTKKHDLYSSAGVGMPTRVEKRWHELAERLRGLPILLIFPRKSANLCLNEQEVDAWKIKHQLIDWICQSISSSEYYPGRARLYAFKCILMFTL